MCVFVLGLEVSFRGKLLIDQLEQLGIGDVNITYGIDGRQLAQMEVRKLYSSTMSQLFNGRRLSRGEIGCALGHKKIYAELSRSDYQWALVLEDDARIEIPMNFTFLGTISSDIPTIIQLYPPDNPTRFEPIGKLNISESNKIYQIATFAERTHGYLINRPAFKLANEIMSKSKIFSPADWPPSWISKVEFWYSDNELCLIADAGSSIEKGRRIAGTKKSTIYSFLISSHILGVLNRLGLTSLFARIYGIEISVAYNQLVKIPRKRKYEGKKVRRNS
jgi:hypothetical protein